MNNFKLKMLLDSLKNLNVHAIFRTIDQVKDSTNEYCFLSFVFENKGYYFTFSTFLFQSVNGNFTFEQAIRSAKSKLSSFQKEIDSVLFTEATKKSKFEANKVKVIKTVSSEIFNLCETGIDKYSFEQGLRKETYIAVNKIVTPLLKSGASNLDCFLSLLYNCNEYYIPQFYEDLLNNDIAKYNRIDSYIV